MYTQAKRIAASTDNRKAADGARRLLPLLLSSVLLCSASLMAISAAQAQQAGQASPSAPRSFSIPAQPLASAINAFIRQTGWQISYSSALARGRTSSAVSGTLTPALALQQLVAGSGIQVRSGAPGSAALVLADAGGNDAAATVDGAIALDTIDVSGGGTSSGGFTADMPYETPGSSAYISAEDINRVPPSTQGDIFKSTPGIISAGSRSGQGLNVNIRGLQGMNRVATLIDGTQQSTSSYTGYRGQTTSVFVDPDLIAGVDITKGPSDGPLGNGAMGGVVNMRTLDARDIVADGKQYGARFKAALGSNTRTPPAIGTDDARGHGPDFLNGDSFNGSLAAATVQDNYELLAAVTRRKTGNYFAGTKGNRTVKGGGVLSPVKPGHEVFNTSEDSFSVLLKGKVRLSEDTSVELSYMRYENDHGEIDDFPYIYSYAPPDQRRLHSRNVDTVTAKLSYNPAGNPLVDVKVSAWLTNVKRDAPGSLEGSAEVVTYGVEAYNNSSLDTPLGNLAVTYGVQASLEDSEGSELWIPYSWDPSQSYLSHAGPTGKRRLASAFSRAKLDVTDWLSFGAGLRYDTYDIDQGPGALAEYGDMSGERLNPSVSVTVQPWKGIQFYAQYVEGWRPPSLRETSFQLGTILYPNPELKPEKAQNYEIGINALRSDVLTGGDSLKFKASYFHNKYKDYVIRDSIAQNWSEPRHFANIPEATFEGVEISLKYDVKRFFLEAGLTKYTEVEFCHQLTGCASKALGIDYAGNYIPPEHLLILTGGVRLFDEKLTLGARATFIGERAVTGSMGGGYITPTSWPKETILDLFGSYDVDDKFSINVSAENITDRYYLDALALTRVPAPGRTIRAGLTAKF